ncbi:jg14084 [Pararge aegeria aegeria]|uniref:Jg14084 protein n=1 Tax=Pararge aegeria aegeria TaxID=348720 RepID=A0A8S4RFP9_9NEOP|nr:jg14084 [Pararge aegeria aegeria]
MARIASISSALHTKRDVLSEITIDYIRRVTSRRAHLFLYCRTNMDCLTKLPRWSSGKQFDYGLSSLGFNVRVDNC